MTLVQIDLRRSRESRPTATPTTAPPAPRPAPVRSAAGAGVLGVALVVLLPLAEPALGSAPTLALLLVGLAMVGLIAALIRPTAEVPPP